MKINEKILQSKNVYSMKSNDEEMSIMNELDIVDEKTQPGHLWISLLAESEYLAQIDEIALDRSQAKFLKTVLDQIL